MSSVQLLDFFAKRRALAQPMVLVTVIETSESTYSKAGQRILIDLENNYCGLISGGCLEGDLVEHAQAVFKERAARIIVYDLRREDELWGLGTGCKGMMRLLLQLIDAPNAYAPMLLIAGVLQGDAERTINVVTQSSHPRLRVGTSWINAEGSGIFPESDPVAEPALIAPIQTTASASSGSTAFSTTLDGCAIAGVRQPLSPLPRILVLGAGPDAVPVVSGFQSLGWRVALGDHRSDYLNRAEFGDVARTLLPHEVSLRQHLRDAPPSAVVIMTHNVEMDTRYIRLLSEIDCAYIGLLGPVHRRNRILSQLDPMRRKQIEGKLHGPAGIDIGADSPGAIALSIVTQVYLELRKRVGNANVADATMQQEIA